MKLTKQQSIQEILDTIPTIKEYITQKVLMVATDRSIATIQRYWKEYLKVEVDKHNEKYKVEKVVIKKATIRLKNNLHFTIKKDDVTLWEQIPVNGSARNKMIKSRTISDFLRILRAYQK